MIFGAIIFTFALINLYFAMMLYRNHLVCDYRIKYLTEFGSDDYDKNLPSYDEMLNQHLNWSIIRLRRYVKRGAL